MSKSKRILCLWSGGLDSTFMIRKLIDKGHNVSAVYIEVKNNVEKTKRERAAIDVLKQGVVFVHPRTGTIEGCFVGHHEILGTPSLMFGMMAGLIHGLLIEISTAMQKGITYDQVAVGYVMGDDAISFIDDFRKVWKSLEGITGPLPELIFPLSKIKKIEIWNHPLMITLKHNVTWCECPMELVNNVPCGECEPCLKMAAIGINPNQEGNKE